MQYWHHQIKVTPIKDVLDAVQDDTWQTFRKSLKGLSTKEKLLRLDNYRINCITKDGKLEYIEQLRIDNYINALLRGGQLKHTQDGYVEVNR